MHGAYRMIEDKIDLLYKEIETGNFSNLQEIHIILSGSKCFYTWWVASGLLTCIQSCGGHGYLNASGLPGLF